jgi:hypothetical protein
LVEPILKAFARERPDFSLVRSCSTIVLPVQTTSGKAHVLIYSRAGCHLCDEAKLAIEAAGYQDKYTLAEVDIESDPNLLKRYGYDIPVITINGVEAFRHRLTPEEFRRAIARSS